VFDHLKWQPPQERGVYIDVGCYDPFVFSNTRLLNLHGWSGINIDANEFVISKFKRFRPADINICCAISSDSREMLFDATGGPFAALQHPDNKQPIVPDNLAKVQTKTLEALLSEHFDNQRPIDLLDVDCEGHDFEVLRGFNFARYRPKLIVVEAHGNAHEEPIAMLLRCKGYELVERRGFSLVYRDSDWFATKGANTANA